MHMGHPGPHGQGLSNGEKAQGQDTSPISASVDDLVSGAAKQADAAANEAAKAEPAEEKPSKKDKAKQMRLVYPDNETSPEEKMAMMPKYAFVPDRQGETTVEGLAAASVVGTIRESDSVIDPTH